MRLFNKSKMSWISVLVTILLILSLVGCSTPGSSNTEKKDAAQTTQPAPTKEAPKKEEPKPKYPEKPVNYVIPFDPGGESDITARAQQKPLEDALGVSVIIQYKIGGGGAVGWSELVNNTKPDGYTFTGFNLPHIILQPLMRDDAGYKTDQLTPIYLFQATPNILVVRKDSDIKTLDDFIQLAKAKPGAITVGGSGSYSANHLGALEFDQAAGIKTTYVPTSGSGDAVPQLLGGHLTSLMTYTTMGITNSNDFRILAVASEKRVPALPDVPTFKELGYDYVEGAYRGIAGPPGMSEDVIKTLVEANAKVNKNPEYKKKLEDLGFELLDYTPDEAKKLIAEKTEYYTKILKDLSLLK